MRDPGLAASARSPVTGSERDLEESCTSNALHSIAGCLSHGQGGGSHDSRQGQDPLSWARGGRCESCSCYVPTSLKWEGVEKAVRICMCLFR